MLQSSVIRKALLTANIETEMPIVKIEIKEITMGAEQRAPLHLHPCPVVGIVTEGTLTYQIEGKEV